MVIVCSKDRVFINRCSKLFRKDDVKQLAEFEKLRYHNSSATDLLLLDLDAMKEETVPSVRTPAVALAAVPAFAQAMRVLQKGVRGYGNRYMQENNLNQAINAVRDGQVWLPPDIVTRMITVIPGTPPEAEASSLIEPLSKREDEVALLVSRGLSNKEIAESINVSVRTVKAHLTSIFAKTGYRDRLELAVKMPRNGIS